LGVRLATASWKIYTAAKAKAGQTPPRVVAPIEEEEEEENTSF
jgi:hypothetical protein